MKKITLFMGLVLASTVSFSQVIVKLTSVPCNTGLEGTYPFEYAGELDGSSTDWGLPNIFDGNNAVSGPLEMVNDGTPGIVGDGVAPHAAPIGLPPMQNLPKSALACDTANYLSQDLSGKIAVLYRGTCEFGFKAYNAQLRGAIGVILINHTGDAVGMAGGAYGTRVTIPVVQIGRVAGDDLYLALNSCPGAVTGFIGSKVGINADDMGSSMGDVVMPKQLATPWDLAQNGTEFPVDLGMWAFNYGTNAQTGVTASVDIQFNGASVYSNTSAPVNFAAPAGLVIDTQYLDLGTFAPASLGVGTYSVTYTLSIAGTDQDPADNTFTFDYKLTNGGDIFAASRTDAMNVPIKTTAYSLNETTTQYDDFEVCINFRDANAGTRGAQAVGMTFSGEPVGAQMDFEVLEVRAYAWNDVFADWNTPPTYTALVQQTEATYFYDNTSNGNLDGQMIYVPFDAPLALVNNQRYLFCVYNASDSIRIGHDSRIDYNATVNNYLQPVAPVKTLPNSQAATWYTAGFGLDATASISVTMDIATSTVEKTAVNVASAPYPNPVANMLTVPVRKGIVGNVTVEIYDLAGKLVISENQTIGTEPLKVNVASIANGAYVFNLTFADGSKDTFKVSVNR